MSITPIKIKTSSLFSFKSKHLVSKKQNYENDKLSNDVKDSFDENTASYSSLESPSISPKSFFTRNSRPVSPDLPDTPNSLENSLKTPPYSPNTPLTVCPNSPASNMQSNTDRSRSSSPENEAVRQRKNNIKERDAFLKSFLNDPEFAEAVNSIGLFNSTNTPSVTSVSRSKTKRKRQRDDSFYTACRISAEQRKSLRLLDKEPIFSYKDLVDDTSFTSYRKRKDHDSDEDFEDLEKVIYKPKSKRTNTSRRATERKFLDVEDVTETMLKKISRKVSEKTYSSEGTSCHQCRQKTTDTKTFCRSKDCIGVRGQFCGVCLLNRYGEDAADALKDPNWRCPVCRDICNCSFCRGRAGKRPTGILTPLAHQSGHKSVKDFLDSLNGKGDYINPNDDPKKLLGFTKDLEYAEMGGGHKEYIGSSIYYKDMTGIIQSLKKKLLM